MTYVKKKEKIEYTQSFPRFCDTYRFNPLTKQPEIDGQLDIVQFVQDNYVDSFSKLLNKTIDELVDNENQPFVHLRDLDDLIEMSTTLDEYREANNIPMDMSIEDIINEMQNKIKETTNKENEKKEEVKQEVQQENI